MADPELLANHTRKDLGTASNSELPLCRGAECREEPHVHPKRTPGRIMDLPGPPTKGQRGRHGMVSDHVRELRGKQNSAAQRTASALAKTVGVGPHDPR